MKPKISVVINTLNEQSNIENAIKSVKDLADEVVVCDMYSEDETVKIAKQMSAKVVYHLKTNFVEPARNYAISQTIGDWVLILDADEELTPELVITLKDLAASDTSKVYVEIPRKNIIFGKWVKATMWWPVYHIRFFKKGEVVWTDKIHSKPKVSGEGLKLKPEEEMALIHHHYSNVSQYLERMNRYTSIQAKEISNDGYTFDWRDLISKPLNEFLSRYFAMRGFEDGLHGLALSLLQSVSFLVLYLKLWELESFKQIDPKFDEVKQISKQAGKDINYWFKYANLSSNPIKSMFQRAKNKLHK